MKKDRPILILEDDPEDRMVLKEALESLEVDFPVHVFQNGEEALSYLMNGGVIPFLIISDINMPLMNGLEFRRKLLENETLRKKSVPFIFLTTAADPFTLNIAYRLGIQGYFEKRVSFEELKEDLRNIVTYWKTSLHPEFNTFELRSS